MRQLTFPFAENAELPIPWPRYLDDDDDGVPVHPVAIEFAGLLAKEFGVPFGDGCSEFPQREDLPRCRFHTALDCADTLEEADVNRSVLLKLWGGEPMVDEYNELISEWNRVRGRRTELAGGPSASDAFFDPQWLEEMDLLDRQQEILELALGAHELLLSSEYQQEANDPS